MSKFRVQIDVCLNQEADAIAIFDAIKKIKNKVYKPTEKETIEGFRKCEYHTCFHDEDPPKPCTNYVTLDFEKG